MSGWGGLVGIFGTTKLPVSEKQATNEDDMSSVAIADYLRKMLPDRHAQFADQYAAAALNHRILQLKPLDFALLHAGVIDRESQAGNALRPRGPGGTGDHTTRWFASDNVPSFADELNLRTGNERPVEYDDGTTGTEIEVAPPAYSNAGVPGWGYGLGQIDFATHRQWLDSHDYKDPAQNLDRSAEILASGIERFGDVRIGVAAYNAGPNHSFGTGDPDRFTTGRNYSADVIARANNFGFEAVRLA